MIFSWLVNVGNGNQCWANMSRSGVLSSLIIIGHHSSAFFDTYWISNGGWLLYKPTASKRTQKNTYVHDVIEVPSLREETKLPKSCIRNDQSWWTIEPSQPTVSHDQASTVKKQIEKGRAPIVHKPSTSPTPSTMSYHEQPSTTVKHQQLCRENPWEATANTVPEPVSHSALCRLRVCEWLPSLLPALFERITSFLNLVWRLKARCTGPRWWSENKTKHNITMVACGFAFESAHWISTIS